MKRASLTAASPWSPFADPRIDGEAAPRCVTHNGGLNPRYE